MERNIIMNKIKRFAAAVCAVFCLTAAGCSSTVEYMGNTVEAELEDGDVFAVISLLDYEEDIVIKLFPQAAPKAVKQFIELANRSFYNNSTFHRVVKDQLIQGGSMTGTGFDGDVAEQEYFAVETNKYMCHYYGAVCMAKNKSGNYCQFYIVNNRTPVNIDEIAAAVKADLDNPEISAGLLEDDKKYYDDYYKKLSTIPAEVKERYDQVGGIYDLDGEDTVFGQVVDGWKTLKAINEVETAFGNTSDDANEIASKPLLDIVIESIEIIRIAPAETTTEEKTRATRATTSAPETSEVIINGIDDETENTEDTADSLSGDEPVETPAEDTNAENTENTEDTVNTEETTPDTENTDDSGSDSANADDGGSDTESADDSGSDANSAE